MVVGNGFPVTPGNAKCGGSAGGTGSAVNMMDVAFGAAKVIAERRIFRLGISQLLLGDDGHFLEVCEGTDVIGLYTGLVPFALVERRMVVSIGHHLADARNNQLIAFFRVHRLPVPEPVGTVRIRKIVVAITGGKIPLFHRRLLILLLVVV